MEEEFVPYEEALVLKELGLDDKPFKEYDTSGVLQQVGLLESHKLEYIPAPLYQQAFRWFIEECGMTYIIVQDTDCRYYFQIDCENISETFEEYKEAELACLKKLIETVKK